MWLHTLRPILDRIAGTVLAVMSLPLQAGLLVAAGCTLGMWPLVRQQRAGLHGRPFRLLKIRTLTGLDTSDAGEPRPESDRSRASGVGLLLRQTGLDEILQLWNVAAGHMALIGPRPWVVREQRAVERLYPDAGRRLDVRPGIVGLSAVSYPRPHDADGYARHVAADLHYIATATPGVDIRILSRAARLVFGRRRRFAGDIPVQATRPRVAHEPTPHGGN